SDTKEIAEWYVQKAGVESVYVKQFVADRTKGVASEELYYPRPLAGKEMPSQFLISENRVQFQIRPYDGFSTGLSLDQRANRSFLVERVLRKRVLTTFAYTCGFSVMCALKGATVTSVDLSRKYLNWGRDNFSVNHVDPDLHFFTAIDIFSFFSRAR